MMSDRGSPASSRDGGMVALLPPGGIPTSRTLPIPQPINSPQPIDPNPAPPRISAQELALLTEAAATKNGTFQCTLCNKQFGYKNGLIRHVRLTHVGEKPYQCNICNRRFGYKHILMEHQNLHFGNRPYACTMCDKRFAARSNLIQHRMVHKRPFNCNMCNKRFDREDQLKKHLFAHPQSLLTCNTCKYAAASQTDLNKHMIEKHHPELTSTNEEMPQNGEETHLTIPPNIGSPMPTLQPMIIQRNGSMEMEQVRTPESDIMRQTEPITPPDSSEEHPPQIGTPPGYPRAMPEHIRNQTRRRIDAICSQLSTGMVNHPMLALQQHYHGVIVKKEAMEEENGMDQERLNGSGAGTPQPAYAHMLPQLPSIEGSTNYHPGMGIYNNVQPLLPDNRSPPTPTSNAGYITPPASTPHSTPSLPPMSYESSSPADEELDIKPQQSALPAIHEVFSRRAQKLPPFGNFAMPALLTGDNRLPMNLPHPELALSMMSPPPTSFPSTTSGVVNPTQRPTAQLPPITQVLRQTKEQAVQHSAPILGFPSLEEVLSYYMSQGRLFKCQHCNILFFERGMYFLHASLHGPSNPWECSICHKICSDKNEFTLHFVNQQHNS